MCKRVERLTYQRLTLLMKKMQCVEGVERLTHQRLTEFEKFIF